MLIHRTRRESVGSNCATDPARSCTPPGGPSVFVAFIYRRGSWMYELWSMLGSHSMSPPNGICCTTTRFPSTSALVEVSNPRRDE